MESIDIMRYYLAQCPVSAGYVQAAMWTVPDKYRDLYITLPALKHDYGIF